MNTLLHYTLNVLSPYYSDPDIEEIAINQPGELWCKYRGTSTKIGWHAVKDAAITYAYVTGLCQKLANIHQLPFLSRGMPVLSTTLPGGHRLQAIIGPNVRYHSDDTQGIAISVRVFSKEKRVTLADFGLQQLTQLTPSINTKASNLYDANPLQDLLMAIHYGEAVLISGATSTGKTSFLNDLISYIPESSRIITIEDARELIVPHPNRVHLLASRTDALNNIGYSELLDVVVRLTPDVLIAGEISMKNVMGIYRLMTTGHANFMATIHASSPEEALKAFYQNLASLHPGINAESVFDILSHAIGRIVQIQRVDGQRMVTAIEIPLIARELKHAVITHQTQHVVPRTYDVK